MIPFFGRGYETIFVVGAPLGKTDCNLKDFNASLSCARLTSAVYHAQDKTTRHGGISTV
jgi:hypothetical protein